MSVRFDNSGDDLRRTSDLPNYNAAYTWMAWVYAVTLPADAATMYCAGTTSWNKDELSLNPDGSLYLGVYGGASSDWPGGGSLSATTWYHVALVRESATSAKVYVDGSLLITNTADASGRGATALVTVGILEADSTRYNPFDGRVAHMKAWTTSLTLAEVQAEKPYVVPLKQASLYGWWPTKSGAVERVKDYGASGRDWTATGTLSDEADPGIAWSPVMLRRSLTPLGTRVASRQVHGG